MLARRRRRRANINTALDKRLVNYACQLIANRVVTFMEHNISTISKDWPFYVA